MIDAGRAVIQDISEAEDAFNTMARKVQNKLDWAMPASAVAERRYVSCSYQLMSLVQCSHVAVKGNAAQQRGLIRCAHHVAAWASGSAAQGTPLPNASVAVTCAAVVLPDCQERGGPEILRAVCRRGLSAVVAS